MKWQKVLHYYFDKNKIQCGKDIRYEDKNHFQKLRVHKNDPVCIAAHRKDRSA